MRHAVQIAKVRGIPIQVHWTFALLVGFVLVVMAGSGIQTIEFALLWLVLLFISVIIHELARSLVARRRGIAVVDIALLPIGGISEIPEPAWMNLVLAAFNMLPALPMDGGRVLRALLARHWGALPATRAAGDDDR